MASPEDTFPAANAEKELNLGQNKAFEVDPVSSEVATSLQIKEQIEAAEEKEREKKDSLDKLKSAIIVSGIIIAMAGALFAIVKKLKEK